jgi:hypothetical protein
MQEKIISRRQRLGFSLTFKFVVVLEQNGTRIEQFAYHRIVDHIHVHGQLDTIHTHSKFTYYTTMHTRVRCESRVRIGRVTIIVHDPAAGIKKHVLSWRCHTSFCSFRIRLESLMSRAFRVMQCLLIVTAGSILC